MKRKVGYIFVILSAVIYGCMPLMAKIIYADGVNSFTLVLLRNLLALPSLALLAFFEKKTLKIPLKKLTKITLVSLLGCAVTPVLLFTSYNFIQASTATVFHFVYPAIVVIAGAIFLKKKLQIGNLLGVILCVVGICFFYSPGHTINFTGSILSLLSGVTFASYIILLSIFNDSDISGFLFSFYIALISSVAMFIFCIVTNSLSLPSSFFGWGMCFIFAMLVTTGAVVLFQQGTFIIGGERASILSALEPTTSVIIDAAFFHISMGVFTIIGSVLVISASVVIAMFDMKDKKSDLQKS